MAHTTYKLFGMKGVVVDVKKLEGISGMNIDYVSLLIQNTLC